MTDYSSLTEQVRNAQSLDEILAVTRLSSANSVTDGGILYSRDVGQTSSEVIAKELSARTGLAIINDTPRAQFLVQAESVIADSATRIFIQNGMGADSAKKTAISFLYGDDKALSGPTSLRGSLWGEASHEFASSLRGDISWWLRPRTRYVSLGP